MSREYPDNRLSLRLAVRPIGNAFRFSGRSTCTEVVALFLLSTLCNMFTLHYGDYPASTTYMISILWQIGWTWLWLPLLVRRLRDQDRSPAWASVSVVQVFAVVAMYFVPRSPSVTGPTFRPWLGEVRNLEWSWPANGLVAAFVIASVAQLVFLLWRGAPGPNRYGPDPRLDVVAAGVTLPA